MNPLSKAGNELYKAAKAVIELQRSQATLKIASMIGLENAIEQYEEIQSKKKIKEKKCDKRIQHCSSLKQSICDGICNQCNSYY